MAVFNFRTKNRLKNILMEDKAIPGTMYIKIMYKVLLLTDLHQPLQFLFLSM